LESSALVGGANDRCCIEVVHFVHSFSHIPIALSLTVRLADASSLTYLPHLHSQSVFTHSIEVIIGSAQERSCGGLIQFWKALPLLAEQMVVTGL